MGCSKEQAIKNLGKYVTSQKVRRICNHCNEEYLTKPSKRLKFCSIQCYYSSDYKKEMMNGNSFGKGNAGKTHRRFVPMSEEHKSHLIQSRKKNGWFKNPESTKNKLSNTQKELWKKGFYNREKIANVARDNLKRYGNPMDNPIYYQRAFKNRKLHIFPNKSEKKLLKIIMDNHLDYKYTGDGTFRIGRKNPDFINCNGKKIAIELFGNYWHDNDDGSEKIKLYSEYGFKTLIIREDELKDKEAVIQKIRDIEAKW